MPNDIIVTNAIRPPQNRFERKKEYLAAEFSLSNFQIENPLRQPIDVPQPALSLLAVKFGGAEAYS